MFMSVCLASGDSLVGNKHDNSTVEQDISTVGPLSVKTRGYNGNHISHL